MTDLPPPFRPGPPHSRRFDQQALRAPQDAADEHTRLATQPALRAALDAWCLDAGGAPCSAAVLQGPGDAPLAAWAQAWSRALDGSHRLAQLGRLAGLWWRLQVAMADRRATPPDPADTPWDAGWAASDAAGHDHLARHWLPRRPTLLLAPASQARLLAPVWAQLQARGAGGHRPLRWLWLQADGGLPAPAVDGPTLRLA